MRFMHVVFLLLIAIRTEGLVRSNRGALSDELVSEANNRSGITLKRHEP
jgi:hypothetical protein